MLGSASFCTQCVRIYFLKWERVYVDLFKFREVFLDLFPPSVLPYGTGVTKGLRIWGGFYVLSVLDSN